MNSFQYEFDNCYCGEIPITDYYTTGAIVSFGNRPELEDVLVNSITFLAVPDLEFSVSGRETANDVTNTSGFLKLVDKNRFAFIDKLPWNFFFPLGNQGNAIRPGSFKTLRFAKPRKVSWGDSSIQLVNVGAGNLQRGSINFAVDFSYGRK